MTYREVAREDFLLKEYRGKIGEDLLVENCGMEKRIEKRYNIDK